MTPAENTRSVYSFKMILMGVKQSYTTHLGMVDTMCFWCEWGWLHVISPTVLRHNEYSLTTYMGSALTDNSNSKPRLKTKTIKQIVICHSLPASK